MPDRIIDAQGLCRYYGSGDTEVRALDGVDFQLDRGEFVAIMGPSGSGKSTLLHVLGALEAPTAGSVVVGGVDFAGRSDRALTLLRRDHIGFVFQFFNLLASLTALENVVLPALIAHRHDEQVRSRASELLERVGLAGRADHLPSQLSGGEQQRVSIARALLLNPELVLADEPTGNLDSRAGAEVLRLLRDLNRDEGHSILMVTHDPSAAAIAGRVVFLRDGRVVSEIEGGSTERVMESFAELQPDAGDLLAVEGGTGAGAGV